MGTWNSKPPNEDLDPDGFAQWRHLEQMPEMQRRFPRAAAKLPPCELCGLDGAGHSS